MRPKLRPSETGQRFHPGGVLDDPLHLEHKNTTKIVDFLLSCCENIDPAVLQKGFQQRPLINGHEWPQISFNIN